MNVKGKDGEWQLKEEKKMRKSRECKKLRAKIVTVGKTRRDVTSRL